MIRGPKFRPEWEINAMAQSSATGRGRIRIAIVAIFACLAVAGPGAAEPHVRPATYERGAAVAGARSVRFDRRAPQVGDQLEQSLSIGLKLDTMVRQANEVLEQSKTALRRHQRRVVTTTHITDGMTDAVKVRYLEAGKQMAAGTGTGKLGEAVISPQPVQGKTYRCRRDGEALLIADADGKIPPLDEYEIVALNMESLGRPNPLAAFLAGRTVAVGERLALPNDVAEKLLGIGGELGTVTRFELTLADIQTIDGKTCALFQANIEAASSDSSQMRLAVDGPLVIQADTCRAVQAAFTGPIGMSETRGSLTATYQLTGTGNMSVEIASKYDDVAR
jgi:hypothetical protein